MVERAQSTSTQLKYPRVLLIVPELGLPLSPETDAFYPLGYSVLTLQNVVTRERIFKAIEKREFEIIHYAGHSDGEGIELSGGVKMDAPALVQIARAVKADLVFLNGCSNIQVGQTLVDEHVPFVICTLSNVDNMMARETAQLFYASLAETNDIRAAYNLSKPPIKGGYAILMNGIYDISLAPIIEKLNAVSGYMARNDSEHADMCQMIRENEMEHQKILHVVLKSRIWNIVIMLAGMVGVGAIVGLAGMLGRGALP